MLSCKNLIPNKSKAVRDRSSCGVVIIVKYYKVSTYPLPVVWLRKWAYISTL